MGGRIMTTNEDRVRDVLHDSVSEIASQLNAKDVLIETLMAHNSYLERDASRLQAELVKERGLPI